MEIFFAVNQTVRAGLHFKTGRRRRLAKRILSYRNLGLGSGSCTGCHQALKSFSSANPETCSGCIVQSICEVPGGHWFGYGSNKRAAGGSRCWYVFETYSRPLGFIS